ncbi:hypothetical protein [Thermoflexibacter ruber]|uniref:Lipoprotein n=1 Tax=Thermoflexibacter ruber TaxID=1003 RepID=A0A1I2I908_9BACT|nr:hypothetical protein [Thermoflexibacter ruber]SFF38153.1 hypothetical protein SAMN04488541_102945 [Thermoflexibacter ruber]
MNNLILKKCALLLLLSSCLFVACENKKKTSSQTQDSTQIADEDPWANVELEDENDPFRGLTLDKKLDAILDSIDIQWYAWNKNDDERNANIGVFIQELAKLPKHNKAALDSVKMLHQRALELKLTQANLSDSKRIDDYDANTELLMAKLTSLMQNTPQIEKCKPCRNLFSQIKNADENEFILRKTYDDNVFILNEVLTKEKNNIEKLGDKYKSIKPFPHFTIIVQ